MPTHRIEIRTDKRLIELLIEDEQSQRWEYGIPYDKRGGFAFEDIEAIRREFGDEYADRLWVDLEDAAEQAVST